MKIATIDGDGERFDVEISGATFALVTSNECVGLGAWSDEEGRLVWHSKPRQPSEVLRAIEFAVLENLRPYCESCCESLKISGGDYCWPCAQHYGVHRD